VELDTEQYPGPYQYVLYRNNGIGWDNPVEVAVLEGLDDTSFMDVSVNLNTNENPYSYRVDLKSTTVGYIDSSQPASSVFLTLHPYNKALRLSWSFKVPWINKEYVIYKKNPGADVFEIIDTTDNTYYFDKGLINHQEYCYYVRAVGHYSVPGIIDPLINFSQIACGEPYDREPPCKPLLWVDTDCDDVENDLTWSLPYDTCNYDVAKYVIYYSAPGPDNLVAIDSIMDPYDTTYTHDNIEILKEEHMPTALELRKDGWKAFIGKQNSSLQLSDFQLIERDKLLCLVNQAANMLKHNIFRLQSAHRIGYA